MTSKAVLEKCRAEGIELKNHMAALSAGLEATIGEWFSESAAGGSAIETAEHVDLVAARKKATAARRRRKKAEEKEKEEEKAAAEAAPAEVPEQPAAAVAVAEAPAEAAVAEAPAEVAAAEAAPQAEAAGVAEAVVAEAPLAEPAPPQAPPEEPPALEKVEEAAREPALGAAVPNKVERPKVIKPAGPQVVPAPAKLKGPRVVRFDGLDVGVGPRGVLGSGLLAGRGAAPVAPPSGRGRVPVGTDEEGKPRRGKRRSPRRKSGRTAETGEGLREWRDRDLLERSARLAAASGGTLRRHRAAVTPKAEGRPTARAGQVEVEEPITVKNLSAAAGIKIGDILRRLMGDGIMANINSMLDRETAETIALEHNIELNVKVAKSAEDLLAEEFAQRQPTKLLSRAPIVTFLGHVDHGKTSLLDRIRNSRVAEGEEGGITQHVGSYRYDVGDRHVVFLDTPGHEAFTAMRARGANMTDVVVLVVAADDGVMPQTVEAIDHAKAAEVPIVVALNKMDLPGANTTRALGQLAERGLQPRAWGGQTEVIETSAVTGQGVEELTEILSLEAELLELKSDPDAPASGWVVEARLDPGRGVLAQLLVRDGTLHLGEVLLAGRACGRVRSILDDRGREIQQAGPSTPVLVAGLDEVPEAGDRFFVVADLAKAKQVAQERWDRFRTRVVAAAPAVGLESMFEQIEAGRVPEVRLVLKADVQGSLEALLANIAKQETEQVKVVVLHSGVGGITEGDVLLAEASEAVVLGFRVVPDQRARALAEQNGVEIRTYRVIYQLLDDLEKAVKGMLAPEMMEQVGGRAEVREIFRISRVGTVAGCYVTEGVIGRGSKVRIIRDNVLLVDERALESLRRFKDDAREVRAGLECGMKIAGFDDVKVGDVIEAYESVEVPTES